MRKGQTKMNVKQRILAIKLSQKIKKHPIYAKKLGVDVKFKGTKNIK